MVYPDTELAAQCFVLILKDSSGDLCRLVVPYKIFLFLCKVIYRTEVIKTPSVTCCYFLIYLYSRTIVHIQTYKSAKNLI